MTLDPVTLAVIQNGLRQVASEMDLVHEKTSFSPVISEGFDRSNGIYDRMTGEVVAQGELGLPIFVGVMQFTTQAVILRRRDLEPGDVILVNDPYLGGTHLMDVKMVRPFYYRGRLWCYLSNTGHWPDTGGMVPGGFSATATEIVQEGLRLPPVKLVRRGEICQDIIDIVLNNIRVAEERIGDIRAQLGALSVGEKRLTQLLDRYGVETVDAAISQLKDGSERLMRAHIDSIPDGTYSATTIVDSDGIVDRPLEVVLDMAVSGSDIHFDLSRSSPPCRGPMNSVWATTQSAVYVAMKHIFPDVPINAGCFAPIHIAPPDGTFLYARYPRPVAGCAAEVAQRIMEAVFGAMGKAIPERLFGAPAGTSGNFGLGGYALSAARTSVAERCALIDDVLNGSAQRFSRVNDDLINTRANLNFDVFADICLVCCVPTQLFADSATFVDVVLLKRRNLIAHGEDTFITIDDLDELTNETITLMRTFGDALENHVYVRDYRAA